MRGICFVGAENVFRRVVAVNVGGDEVDGNMIFDAVADETVDPSGLRRRWPADAQPRAHGLQGARSGVVERVIGLLLRVTRPEIEVGLVPNFEIPLRDFVDAVAIDQVLGEMR